MRGGGRGVSLPTAAIAAGRGASPVLGGRAIPAATVLTATSTTPVVTVNLDAAQQTEVKAGDRVSITLPDGASTPGKVSSVSTVATASGGSAAASASARAGPPRRPRGTPLPP